MKPIFPLLFLFYSCGAQTPPQPVVTATFDPYFVKTTDTFSSRGPHSIVRDLLQDSKGTYWFASWQGIISYDGKIFTNHTLKDGLIHFHVFSVYEDKKGILWFGTVRGGLYGYDGKFFKLFTIKDGLADNTINCTAEDRDGNIWFGTPVGASRYDGRKFTTLTKADGLPRGSIESILLDRKGMLWFGARPSFIGPAAVLRAMMEKRSPLFSQMRVCLSPILLRPFRLKTALSGLDGWTVSHNMTHPLISKML